MKVKEVIQRIQSLYSRGVQSDDSRLSARHIYSVITSIRSLLISQAINKKQKISDWNYQTLPCVELIKVEAHDCPCLPPIGCKMLRTKEKIPKPLSDLSMDIIRSVTSVDGSIQFSYTTWEAKKYKVGSKYTSRKPDYFIKDEYLYITTPKGPKAITIIGLFEDPLDAAAFPSICPTEECCPDCESALDKDFAMEDKKLKPLVDMAVQELIGVFDRGSEDTDNNSREATSRGGTSSDALLKRLASYGKDTEE